MPLEELRERIEELEDTRRLAQVEIESLTDREGRVKELERDRDALLRERASVTADRLDNLPLEKRNEPYRMLHLEVTPSNEGFEVRVAFCTSKPLQAGTRRPKGLR
jgi:FtsZ-binding cell division protein ZapB